MKAKGETIVRHLVKQAVPRLLTKETDIVAVIDVVVGVGRVSDLNIVPIFGVVHFHAVVATSGQFLELDELQVQFFGHRCSYVEGLPFRVPRARNCAACSASSFSQRA